jgi:MraZ protein
MDGAGRLNVPNTLKAYAGLDKDITLVSGINKIEIWDTESYNKLFEDFSATEFSNLAAQVMGGQKAPVSNPLSGII